MNRKELIVKIRELQNLLNSHLMLASDKGMFINVNEKTLTKEDKHGKKYVNVEIELYTEQ